MSMYEIEGLVESSIITLDKSKNKSLDRKTIIWNLYHNIQNNFDCSFTNFRVMDILLKTSFTNTIEIKEHPDYDHYKAYFKELTNKNFEFICKNPLEKWDGRTNPSTSYYSNRENKIFFDYGSLLWKRIVQEDEPDPKNIDVFEIGLIIMREAQVLGYTDLIYEWYGFTINFFDWFSKGRDFEELKSKYFIEMKEIFLTSGAKKNIPEHHPSLHVHDQDELKKISIYFDENLLKIISWFIK